MLTNTKIWYLIFLHFWYLRLNLLEHIIYVSMGRYEYIFLHYLRCTCHQIVSFLEDEDASAVIFMKPNDGSVLDRDSANENDGCLIDNIAGSQLNAPAEALLSDGRRIKSVKLTETIKVSMRNKLANN